MSGIFAVWDNDRGHPRNMLTSIAAGLCFAGESTVYDSDDRVGVGVSSRFSSQQIFANEAVLLVCDAELYNEDELRTALNVPVPPASPNASTGALLAAYYDMFGSAFVDKLRGGFSVILWDRRA